MKYLLLLPFVLLSTISLGQNVVKTISITPGEGSVTSYLPFDRPINLKWISKEPIILDYVGLVEIEKGNVSDYYREWAQNNDFYALQQNVFEKDTFKSKLKVTELQSSTYINADGKYEVVIKIPPLQPNRFYDIKLIRKPFDSETDLYLDLFLSNADDIVFKKKLTMINRIKKPFTHEYLFGKSGLTLAELHAFYDVFLKNFYAELTAAGTDKDKIAAAKAKIKATFILDLPPGGIEQTTKYIEIFKAINASDVAAQNKAIGELAEMQKGYVVPSAANHVGDWDAAKLKAFYLANPKLAALVASLPAAKAATTETITKQILVEFVLPNQLPFADYMFTFGQTLSTTTTVLDFDTRTTFTLTPDFGYVYTGFKGGSNTMVPYVGLQIEFRYFDKNIPFGLIHPKTFWHYLSFTTGLTLTSLKKEGKRDDFFANKSLLAGLGVRLTSATRITFGGILFNKEDPNPIIDNKKLAVTPYIGLSIDLKIKSLLNDFYGLISTKKP